MNYTETVQYLFNALPMYQRVGKQAYKANLDNTHKLDTYFDKPHKHYKTIHVGGTNGKGSTSHMLASVLQHNGYKVGLYTSPHLLDFRERIKVDGIPVSEDFVVAFTQQHKDAFEEIEPSFFEMTVFMAFEYFKHQQVDYAIIEVGLGGRLDSTNVIQPVLSIITNIGMDHTEFLGNTLKAIATEKAGIIKPNIPVVIGESNIETAHVFNQVSNANNSPITYADKLYEVDYAMLDADFNPVWYFGKCEKWKFKSVKLDLKGAYQKENLKTTLASLAVLQMQGCKLTKKNILKGLSEVISTTGILGRWEVFQNNPAVIGDIAHNKEGITTIIQQLQQIACKTLRMVLGFVNDKAIDDIIKLLPTNSKYYLCQPSIPRAMHVTKLELYFTKAKLNYKSFKTVYEASEQALADSDSDDLIYIGGSTFVVADYMMSKKNNISF